MRYLELLVTDISNHPDGHDPAIRTEWIHRDHIETIEPYLADDRERSMLWLQLTLTSGRIRYIPLRPVDPEHADDVARTAIGTLLEGHHPVRGAVLETDQDDDTGWTAGLPN